MMSRRKLERLLIENKYSGMEKPLSLEDYKKVAEENCKADSEAGWSKNPRTGETIYYAPKRLARGEHRNNDSCPVCDGNTTPIIFSRDLPSGNFGFVNYNLNPALSPGEGLHFLVWPTNEHKDIHEISTEDYAVSFDLLGDIESILIDNPEQTKNWDMQTIKNVGKSVGGSIEHGHFQSILSKQISETQEKDMKFKENYSISFSRFYLKTNPINLKIRDYGNVLSSVPEFMRRPLDAIVMPKRNSETTFSALSYKEKIGLAKATQDIVLTLSEYLPEEMNREFAYNMVFHSGLEKGCYIEILPNTQTEGGFERAGMSVCQMTPEKAVQIYRDNILR